MIDNIKKNLIYFFGFSFMGWLWEILFHLIKRHQIINPGTLIGPWLPIYGWVMLVMIMISKKINKKSVLFIISFFTCGVIEYTTSLYLEYFYNKRWWNYSKYLLNINGRICVEVLIVFSILILLGITYIVPLIDKIYYKLNKRVITIILVVLVVCHSIDLIYSTFYRNTTNITRIKRIT